MSDDPDPLKHPPPDPLADALARLEPAPPNLDRDRLMFLAGAESRRPVIRLWQFTAGVLAAVGFAVGAGMYFRPPVVVEKAVPVPAVSLPADPPQTPPPQTK
jgi:hypothetical protein